MSIKEDGVYCEIDPITYGITRFYIQNGEMTILNDDGTIHHVEKSAQPLEKPKFN